MMRNRVLSEWITDKSLTDGHAKIKAFNERMIVMELHGRNVLQADASGNFDAVFLLLTNGSLSFVKQGVYNVIPSPAYIDFVLVQYWNDIKTSDDFKGYLVAIEQLFFLSAVEKIRFNLSEIIYRYKENPFVLLEKSEALRMDFLIGFLIDTINKQEHCFRDEIMKCILQTLCFDLWSIISCIYSSDPNGGNPFWNDVVGTFLHLVRTNCRKHHEVKWYAEQLCVSADSLSARLKKAYGKNANQLIDEALMVDAKNCLLDERYSIQNVAELLNFSDQAAFGKFFKRCCGMSPGMFRKERKDTK